MVDWLLLGIAGWCALMIFRLATEGIPDSTFIGYMRGLVLSLVLGPLCFIFLGFLLYRRIKDGKASSRRSND